MPDITMCRGTDCPYKEWCYRFTANPSDYQSYFFTPPIEDGKCNFYWGDNAESIWNELNDIVDSSDSK